MHIGGPSIFLPFTSTDLEFLEFKAENFLYIWILKKTHNTGNLTWHVTSMASYFFYM